RRPCSPCANASTARAPRRFPCGTPSRWRTAVPDEPTPLARACARASLHPDTDMSTASKKASTRSNAAKTGTAAEDRRATARDGRLLDPVLAAVRKRAGKSGGEAAATFAAAFYQRMGEDE